MLCWLGIKPSEDRDITARPQSNQNRVNRTLPFVIGLQLRSETTSLDPNNRVDVRIVLRGAVEHLHCNRELLEAIDISIDCPIHDVRQKPHSRTDETKPGLFTTRANGSRTAVAGTRSAAELARDFPDDNGGVGTRFFSASIMLH